MKENPNKVESFLRLRKGASTLEYIIIIAAAVILAFILYNFISGGTVEDKVNGKIQSALEGKVDSTQGNGSPSPETPPPPKPKPKPTPPPKKEEKKGFFEKIVDNPIVQETTNFVLDSVPVVSNIKSGYEAISGKDIFGNELSTADRIAAGAGIFIPGAKHGKRLLNGVEKVADATGILKPGCAAKKKKKNGTDCKADFQKNGDNKWKPEKNVAKGELGDLLGSGGNKDVFAYGDDKAIGMLKPGKPQKALQEELYLLDKLDEAGLPTVNAKPINVDGQPALMFDRFAQGSKDIVKVENGKVVTVGDSPLLNQQSINDLKAIRNKMQDEKIKIDDLQFLIGDDGRVVIADPLNVHLKTKPSPNNLQMIDKLIEAAEKNVK